MKCATEELITEINSSAKTKREHISFKIHFQVGKFDYFTTSITINQLGTLGRELKQLKNTSIKLGKELSLSSLSSYPLYL